MGFQYIGVHWRSKTQPASSTSSADVDVYAFSVRDAQFRFYIAEQTGIAVNYPTEIFIDNETGVLQEFHFKDAQIQTHRSKGFSI